MEWVSASMAAPAPPSPLWGRPSAVPQTEKWVPRLLRKGWSGMSVLLLTTASFCTPPPSAHRGMRERAGGARPPFASHS